MKLLRRATTIFDGTCDYLAFLAGIVFAFIMLLTVTEVVMRYAFRRPIAWSLGISEFCLLFITFLGAAWLLRKERHVRMDFIINSFEPRVRAMIDTITSAMCIILMGIVTWYGAVVTSTAFQTGALWGQDLMPPAASILFIIPLGSLLLFIQFVRRTCGFFKAWRTPITPKATGEGETISL